MFALLLQSRGTFKKKTYQMCINFVLNLNSVHIPTANSFINKRFKRSSIARGENKKSACNYIGI